MRVECRVIFEATEKEASSRFSKPKTEKLDLKNQSSWLNLNSFPEDLYDITYHFEIRKLKKLGKFEDWRDLPLLHRTESKPWKLRPGSSDYIHWADIPFRFNHDKLEIYIESNTYKI